MLEKLWRRGPFVRLELPLLASREDRNQTRPVLGLEVRRAIDEDELGWPGTTAASSSASSRRVGWIPLDAEGTSEFHEICFRGRAERGMVGRYEDTVLEEGFDV